MRRLLLLMGIALVVFCVVFRQRIYVWDILASVTRDGVKQSSVRVMINFSNDVLMDDTSGKSRRIYLLQHWNNLPQYSTGPLRCVEYLACMTDADHATGDTLTPGHRDPHAPATPNGDHVEFAFTDETGAAVQVSLR